MVAFYKSEAILVLSIIKDVATADSSGRSNLSTEMDSEQMVNIFSCQK